MRYCPNCYVLQEEPCLKCKLCGKKTLLPKKEDIVLLTNVYSSDADFLCTALTDADILWERKQQMPSCLALQQPISILVHYGNLEKAQAILLDIGAPFPDVMPNLVEAGSSKEATESPSMAMEKNRFWIRLISFVGILLLIGGVLFLSDTIIGWIKQGITGMLKFLFLR